MDNEKMEYKITVYAGLGDKNNQIFYVNDWNITTSGTLILTSKNNFHAVFAPGYWDYLFINMNYGEE